MASSPTPHFITDPRPAALEDALVPSTVRVGAGSALLLRGTVAVGAARDARRIRVGTDEYEIDGLAPAPGGDGERLLWWSLVTLTTGTGAIPISLLGEHGELPMGELRIEPAATPPPSVEQSITSRAASPPASEPLVAICMATHEPDPRWLRRQIDSIREGTHERWICLISDDASSPAAVAAIEELIAGDERFVLDRSPARLGFYANFERALGMVPPEADLVALSDQDDRWHPGKLTTLAAELRAHPKALLAYSDMRVVDEHGAVISDTFWYQSANAYEDIATLAIVNTVTGGACLFRRELLDLALPFPPAFSDQHYHDHWLALCALALGQLAYLDEPTYDYTRHAESITLAASRQWTAPPEGALGSLAAKLRIAARRARLALAPGVWPAAYLDRYLMLRQYIAVLRLRAWEDIDPGKRHALDRLDAAERSPAAAAWLAARTIRPLLGRNETLGRERVLLGGLLWRRLASARAALRVARGARSARLGPPRD